MIVNRLTHYFWVKCLAQKWALLIDRTTRSHKNVLLHNGNKHVTLPIILLSVEYMIALDIVVLYIYFIVKIQTHCVTGKP